MNAVEVQHYLGRARDFKKGMEFLKDDLAEFKSSSALLGIHSAISYCDALRTGMGCVDVSSEDHGSAVKDLKLLLASRNFNNRQGADRLGKILSRKSRIAYASDAVRKEEVEEILKQAERFAFWAEETGRQLRIKGW
jgi:hypothetical protein